jgi:hypothetical protein
LNKKDPSRGNYRLSGDDTLATPNEPNGMPTVFWLRDAGSGPVTIRVADATPLPIGMFL